MANSIQRDKKKRVSYSKNELKRLEFLSLIQDFSVSKEIRSQSVQQLNHLPSRTALKNRCILTGRGHSVLRFCSLSRLKFRELAAQGVLMGVTKASW